MIEKPSENLKDFIIYFLLVNKMGIFLISFLYNNTHATKKAKIPIKPQTLKLTVFFINLNFSIPIFFTPNIMAVPEIATTIIPFNNLKSSSLKIRFALIVSPSYYNRPTTKDPIAPAGPATAPLTAILIAILARLPAKNPPVPEANHLNS